MVTGILVAFFEISNFKLLLVLKPFFLYIIESEK